MSTTYCTEARTDGALPHEAQLPHPFTLMVLDDHALIRAAVSAQLGKNMRARVLGEYSCSRTFMAAVSVAPPDVAVIDFSLGPGQIDGLKLIKDIRLRARRCRILVISSHQDGATVMAALSAGAHGFFGKSQALTDLFVAVTSILRGRVYVQPATALKIAEMKMSVGEVTAARGGYEEMLGRAKLSLRELEVIRCCLEGMTTGQIARKYRRQVSTISTQKMAALRKLGLNSLGDLFRVRYASGAGTRE